MGGLTDADLTALGLTLELSALTSLSLVVLATPLALWLAVTHSRIAPWIEALVSLPLVLPPTVLGFYLLWLLGREGPVGALWERLGFAPLAFSFEGIYLGSLVYSLPFVVQPLSTAFKATGRRLLEVAATLRASPVAAFFTVILPLSRNGFLVALVLSFAHTLGEFGVVLMLGGSIPGRTETASIAIFSHVEAMEYGAAHRLSAALLGICFALLLTMNFLSRSARLTVLPR